MLYRIAICDDEISQIKNISDYLTRFSIKTDTEFQIERFTSGNELLKKYYNEKSPFDILFLDMEMPGRNGIETAEEIRRIPDRNVLIAFITSYPEYMQDSFDINGLETNITVLSQKSGETILYLDDIICIEANKNSNLIITTQNEEIVIKGKINNYEKELANKYFISIHRSCLANMKYIRKFNADSLEFSTGKIVPVSRRKLSEIKEAFSKYMVMRYKR